MLKIGNITKAFIAFTLCASIARAASDVRVQSSVDRNEVGINDPFTMTVSVLSSESVEMQEPLLADLEGFALMNKWSQTSVSQKLVQTSSGMQFETQRRQEFHYQLAAQHQGNLNLPSVEVVVEGKVYRTQPIVIKASTGGAQRAQPNGGNNQQQGLGNFDDMDSAEEDLFNQLLQQRQQLLQHFGAAGGGGIPRGAAVPGSTSGMEDPQYRSLPKNPNEAFFIQVEVDKTDVYEGEQVTVNWYLYTRGQMETLDRLKFPDLRGFWKEIIEEVPTIQFSEEIVNGVAYRKALLASHALFPIKAGTAYIDEYKIKSRVRLPTNGMGGFFGRPYEFTKSSDRVKINVRPLPLEGRPSDFSSAVGNFEINASAEGQNFPVNQPFSLKVRFEGAGNAKVIDLPAIQWPQGLEMYDTKSESKFFKNGRSYKEFEVLLIPRQEGEITIPSLSASFFDPKSQKYYTKKTQELKITVVNNPNAAVGASNRVNGPVAPAVVKQNALPEVMLSWDRPVALAFMGNAGTWAGVYLGILLALLWRAQRVFGFGRRRKTLRDLVQKRWKKVDAALQKQDVRAVGAEVTNIFYIVLGETVGEGGASQEMNRLLEKASPSLRRDYGADIVKYFDIFQTLSFAPEEMLGALKNPEQVKANVNEAKKLISQIISQSSEVDVEKS